MRLHSFERLAGDGGKLLDHGAELFGDVQHGGQAQLHSRNALPPPIIGANFLQDLLGKRVRVGGEGWDGLRPPANSGWGSF